MPNLMPGVDLNLYAGQWRYWDGRPGDQPLWARVTRVRLDLGRRFDGHYWVAVQVFDGSWVLVRLCA